MIRVLFYLGSLGAGGSERQVLELVRLLDRRRFQPLLYLQQRTGELLDAVPADVPVHAFLPDERLTVWHKVLGKLGLFDGLQARHLAKVMQRESINVVCDRTWPALMMTAAATRLCRAKGHRVRRVSQWVAAPQKDLDDYGLTWTPRRWQQTRRALLEADAPLANSQQLRDRVVQFFEWESESLAINVMPNLLNVERIDQLSQQPLSAANSDDRFRIVCGGRLIPVKGYRFLLDAIRLLVHEQHRTNLQVEIFGQGPQLGELQQLCREFQIESQVTFRGYVENPYREYRAANLFCLPSLSEGMPNALMEAVLCEVPVIAADCDFGPREILHHGEWGGLVPPGDSLALATAIADCIDHYATWKSRTAAARQSVIDRYSSSALVPKWETLLETLAR